jgi:hypothetical protein
MVLLTVRDALRRLQTGAGEYVDTAEPSATELAMPVRSSADAITQHLDQLVGGACACSSPKCAHGVCPHCDGCSECQAANERRDR